MNIDKLVLTDEEIWELYPTGWLVEEIDDTDRAISLATVKKAEPLIRKDERKRIFREAEAMDRLQGEHGAYIVFSYKGWQALKVTVEKEV